MYRTETIYDCPGYRIYKPHSPAKYRPGDVIAIPYESRRYGTMYRFYTLGCVTAFALDYAEDPLKAHADAVAKGHATHWANQNSVCIHNGPHTKEERPGHNFGDVIHFAGHDFRLDPAPNDNCKLVQLD